MTIKELEEKIKEVKDNEYNIAYLKNSIKTIRENEDAKIMANFYVKRKEVMCSFGQDIVIEMFERKLQQRREEYKNNVKLLREAGLLIEIDKLLLED